MRVADIRQNSELRARDRDQARHVAVLARTEFDDDDSVVALRRGLQQQLAHTDLVILVLGSGQHAIAVARGEQLREKGFRRRLAGAAGDATTCLLKSARAAPASAM